MLLSLYVSIIVKTNGHMKRSVNRESTEDAEDEVHQYREQNPEQEPQERDIENSQTRRSRARSRSSRSSRGAPTVKLVEVEHVVEVHEAAGEHHMLTVRMRISTAKTPNVEQRVVELKRQGVKKVRAGTASGPGTPTITIAHAMCERPCAFQRRL